MVPPVPIPNTVVKHSYAESTCLETGWEDRELLVQNWFYQYDSSIAQPVEHLTVNQAVAGSNPARGANMLIPWGDWGIAKSVKARDFDSRIRWFESSYPSQIWFTSSVGRAPDF